ncbi:MAG: hypothetical protein M3P29_00465 [Acidobacteriota bacterium]|nr:hypothetical protein [Acidobacteriota bacterium]
MRRHYALLAVLLLAGCASSADDDPNAPKVTVHLEQLDTGGGNNFFFAGAVNLQYALSVTNTTKDLVTLSRLEVRTISTGAYSISPTSTNLNLQVGPGQSMTTAIAIWGYARGGNLSSGEPVTLRGTAYFSGPSGAFVRLFTEYITQR